MVVHLLTYVPVGTMAWRANQFCAILGALAAANIAQCVFALTSNGFSMIPLIFKDVELYQRQAASICAGLMYAFSPLVWTYSVGSEVFAMNNFFASLLVLLTLHFAAQTTVQTRNSAAVLGAFVCGLGMCNQHTQILFQIPLVIFVLWSLRANMTITQFASLAAAFLLGLMPYIYLPLGSIYFPKRGAWGDMSSWAGFWRHLRRADYGTFRLYSRDDDTQGLIERLVAHGWDYAERQSLWVVGPLMSLVGIACCMSTMQTFFSSDGAAITRNKKILKKKKSNGHRGSSGDSSGDDNGNGNGNGNGMSSTTSTSEQVNGVASTQVGIALVCFFLFYEFGFHSLSNLPLDNPLLFGIHARFWMQPNIILFVWMGVGLVWSSQRLASCTCTSLSSSISIFLSILLVSCQLWRWSYMMDQRSNQYLEQYARGILESLPPKSLFFTNYDQQWTASRYLHVCEHVRSDIPFINLSMMTFWWFYRQRELFPEIKFPKRCTGLACGAYLGSDQTAQYKRGEAFTFKELLDANVDRFPGGKCGLF